MGTLRVEKAPEFSGSCWNGVQKQWLETSGAGEAVRGDERGLRSLNVATRVPQRRGRGGR